jgi:16S rRNA (guanine966-N2)-methyltransferase
MRIISGKHKGRKIKAPIIDEIRPTTDFAKTGLFNILNNHYDFEGLVVLDLFAGFGNIAFEFASRGAQFVDAVDNHPQGTKFIRQFAEQLKLPVNIYNTDALEFLNKVHQKYDVIFADPPYYNADVLSDILRIVEERYLLKPGGMLILEHEKEKSFKGHKNLIDERKYGKVHFSFFKMDK